MRTERRYSVHGLGLTLSGDTRVLAALDARLALFASEVESDEELRFEFSSGPEHTLERPLDAVRPVYDTALGEVAYSDATDQLYIALGDRVRALCNPAAGLTRVSICNPDAEDLWLLSHPILTLPLLEMLKRRGLYGLHAAGVSCAGRGLILAGTSGAGKTTLAVALVRSGFDFLGDDLLFLSPAAGRPRVRAFHDEVDVTETTAAFSLSLRTGCQSVRQAGPSGRSALRKSSGRR